MQPTRLFTAGALAALAALAACGETAPRPSSAQTARATSAAAPPAAVGTRFDGRYTGTGTLTSSRSNDCGALSQNRSVTVVNGNATYVVDQVRNVVVTGPVQADGAVSMTSTSDSSSRVNGRIQDGEFRGEYNSRACQRTLQLRRGAPRN